MKFKKWWMPAVFMLISAAVFVACFILGVVLSEDNSMTNYIYFLIGMGIWFFLALPGLSLIYSRRVLAGESERILFTLYDSLFLVLPFVALIFMNTDNLIPVLIFYIWAEMWALLGLAGKGEKRADVWYVPLFIGFAAAVVQVYLGVFLRGYIHVILLSCVACPIAVAIYSRVCVRDRNGRVFYSAYVSLAMLISVIGGVVYDIAEGRRTLAEPTKDIAILIAASVATLAVYMLVALFFAGVRPKPKKKKDEPIAAAADNADASQTAKPVEENEEK